MRKKSNPKAKTMVFKICQPNVGSLKNHKTIEIKYGTELSIDAIREKTAQMPGRKQQCMKRFMLRFPAGKSLRKSTLIPVGYGNPTFKSIKNFVKNIVDVIPADCHECKQAVLLEAAMAKKRNYHAVFQSELLYAFIKQAHLLPKTPVKFVGCDDEGNMYVRTARKKYFIFDAVLPATIAA